MESNSIIEGRKTFFIAPDASLLPESYLEDFLSRGYEAYIIKDDLCCPLKEKVRIIIETFPDSIVFFFIDAKIAGIDWYEYISTLQKEYDGRTLIGVLYTKGRSAEEKKMLERYFLFDVGVQCGCIALEYQKSKNFDLVNKVMFANQAGGRRRNLRAICDVTSKANFEFEGVRYNSNISDISLSHFSFVLDKNTELPDIPLYERIDDMFLNFNGVHFRTSCTLILKRVVNDDLLYVFLFLKQNGQSGLDAAIAARVSERIYQMVIDKVKKLLQQLFDDAGKKIRAK